MDAVRTLLWGASARGVGSAGAGLAQAMRLAPAALVVIAICIFALQFYVQRYFLHDDALISLRFARNLLQHGVLEWNIGERVEGYTNFLHLLVTTGVMWLGFDPVVAVRIVNVAAMAGLLAGFWGLLRRAAPGDDGRAARALGLSLVLLSAPFVIWVLGGLETVMAAALLTAGVGLLLPLGDDRELQFRRQVLAGLALGCAVLTRPDCVVPAGAALAGYLLLAPRRLLDRVRVVGVVGGVLAAVVLAHVAWRYGYYGDLLPNTYYAKVGVPISLRLQNGGPYLLGALVRVPVLWIAGLMLMMAALDRRVSPAMGILAAAIGCQAGNVVWAGGDHMPASRLLVPVMALAALLAALALQAMSEAVRGFWLVAAGAMATYGAVTTDIEHKDSAAFVGTIVGRHLEANEKPGTVVALTTAGSTPYFAPSLRFIDTLGLVDRTIARRDPLPFLSLNQRVPGHAKGYGAYVLARRPHLVILGTAPGSDVSEPWWLSDVELMRSEEFHRCYRREDHALRYGAAEAREKPGYVNPIAFIVYRRHCAK